MDNASRTPTEYNRAFWVVGGGYTLHRIILVDIYITIVFLNICIIFLFVFYLLTFAVFYI